MLMPSAKRLGGVPPGAASWSTVCGGVGLRPALIFGRQLIEPAGDFRPAARRAAREPESRRTGGRMRRRPASCSDGAARSARRRSFDRIVAQRLAGRNPAAASAFPSTQVAVDGRRSRRSSSRARRDDPVRALVAGRPASAARPAVAAAGSMRQPQPADQLMTFRLAAQQAPQAPAAAPPATDPGRTLRAAIASVSASPRRQCRPSSGARSASWQPCSSTHRLASRLPLSTVET